MFYFLLFFLQDFSEPLLCLWASQVALVVKNPPANAGVVREAGLIPGSGRSHGEGNGNPLQCSCLGNPMDREAWLQFIGLQRFGHNLVIKQQFFTYHIFIHSSVNGHLGCFHVLAIVNCCYEHNGAHIFSNERHI